MRARAPLCLLLLAAAPLAAPDAAAQGAAARDAAAWASEAPPPPRTAEAASAAPGPTWDRADLPPAALDTLDVLSVRSADLGEVLRAIATEHGLNLLVDEAVDERVTVRLSALPVLEAVAFLCREHDLELARHGSIFRVTAPPPPPEPEPEPLRVAVARGPGGARLSVDLRSAELEGVVRAIAEASGLSVALERGTRGAVSGLLQAVPLEEGLETLMETNGFAVRRSGAVYLVGYGEAAPPGGGGAGGGPRRSGLRVEVTGEGRVSLDVRQAPVADVLRELSRQLEHAALVTYQEPEGAITARVEGLTVEEALSYLFKGTEVTYRRERHGTGEAARDVFVVGDKGRSGIATTRLVRLAHLRAEGALELIPPTLARAATIQVVKEHNGLSITGTHDAIEELERFVEEIDFPTPQILIEALVVDYETTDLFELGLTLGKEAGGGAEHEGAYRYEDGAFDLRGDAREARSLMGRLRPMGEFFGVRNLGHLPDDFYFRLQALAREGKAEIRSRPQIATLNGHAASLSIGTTQYYILKSETPLTSPGHVVVQESERFETIEANVKLEITPWVSASGEVTTEIKPEFSTPVGGLDPTRPPTINSRILDSTVRLRDGETIILGGLIQESEAATYHKVPILGSIPLLGRLFRTRSTNARKSELVIYLTPHVFYGDETEAAKWRRLEGEMGLSRGGRRRDGDAAERGGLGYTRFGAAPEAAVGAPAGEGAAPRRRTGPVGSWTAPSDSLAAPGPDSWAAPRKGTAPEGAPPADLAGAPEGAPER